MTKELAVKELDFDNLKEQFVEFLKTQTTFKDYNFAGTNMSVLIDLLAYNTYQNAFQRNMAVNEMFLDSARLPASVASHAKFLNYVPNSRIASRATLQVELTSETNAPFLTLPAYTSFNASAGGQSYKYYTLQNYIFKRANGEYVADIDVYEGKIMEESLYIRGENPVMELSRNDIDMSTIKLHIIDKNGNSREWTYAPNLFNVVLDSEVFYLQTSNLETYQLYFGENNFGKSPEIGSTARVTYLYTSGAEANGTSRFTAPSATGDLTGIRVLAVKETAKFGSERESINSIKSNAPLMSQAQRRAIVESDYQSLLKERFPQIQSISAIGGEKLNPPEYGKVAIVVDVQGMDGVPEFLINEIKLFLKERSPITVDPVVKPASFAYVSVLSNVKYNAAASISNISDITNDVMNSIISYSDENLDGFNKVVRLSQLQKYIDNSENSILSNTTRIMPIIEIYPKLNIEGTFRVSFNTRLVPNAEQTLRSITSLISNHGTIPALKSTRDEQQPAIISSTFTYNDNNCYFTDDGYGMINIIRESDQNNIVIAKNVGTVDYDTGEVIIRNFAIQDVYDSRIKIYASTRDTNIKAPTGSIIKIRKEDVVIEVIPDA